MKARREVQQEWKGKGEEREEESRGEIWNLAFTQFLAIIPIEVFGMPLYFNRFSEFLVVEMINPSSDFGFFNADMVVRFHKMFREF